MAEALLSPLFSLILENLNSRVLREFGILSGLKAEIDTLKSTFTTIQAVLQDAESKQRTRQAVRDWLKKLKAAAYDLDNILDEISTEALIRSMNRERGFKHRLDAVFSYRNPILFRLKMGSKVKEIKKRLDAIAKEKSDFHFSEGTINAEIVAVDSRLTSSFVNESEIIGRNEEKEMIIEKLINNTLGDQDDVGVYAIRGMGGLGKTTLSQLVYNDERVKGRFDLHIWVCVSDDFNIRRLIGAILESVEGSPCSITELDPLQVRLQEKLKGRRFLLVLDDVWNENHENWDRLKNALRSGGKGSMVVVTTRSEKVALMMATLPVHHMGFLSEEDSWSLFKRRAFGIGGMEENSRLETIGKEIVNKCKGLPLAIKALGSLMRFKRSEDQWLLVKESEIWELTDDGSSILPALRLSFDNLPPYSKRCFAYCCIFPKDYVMKRDVLIKFWMANSFLPSRGQADLFVVGCEIFDDLVWRSFFQDVTTNREGEMTCKMHDLMHDLAQFLMGDECLIIEDGNPLKIPEELRHLNFASRTIPWTKHMPKVKSLRTLVRCENQLMQGKNLHNVLSPCISQYKDVRVLYLGFSCFYLPYVVQSLPESIGNLIHLRYLDVSYSHIKSLPKSTCCLQNLQTLNLRGCFKLLKLPKGMKYMKSLQYLDISKCYSLVGMPAGMGQMTRLQTLAMFIVGQRPGCQVKELEELNLEGELSIKGLDNVRNSADAKIANLKSKDKLISLSLSWQNQNKDNLPENAEEVLEGLQPHSNLKKLKVEYYQGSRLPNWMMSGMVFENLVELSFTNCERCEQVPSLGKLPFLRILALYSMDDVKSLDNNFYRDGEISFPALEVLELKRMKSLEEWKTAAAVGGGRGGESFPRLQSLCIVQCPKLTELPPHLPRLERLEVWDVNSILVGQVMNLPSISSLEIGGIGELMVLPNGLLKSHKVLQSLSLQDLSNLRTLSNELDNLTALKSLSINRCPSLESLPEGLKNLKSLELTGCDGLKSLNANGMLGLSSLRSLFVRDCKSIESLSDGVRHLTALQNLVISNCPEMKCLPDGLRRLSTLTRLDIDKCPDLERRCKKDTGEDWPKISHIASIRINDKYIQNLRP